MSLLRGMSANASDMFSVEPTLIRYCLDRVVLDGSWIYRRKAAVELINDVTIGHRLTIDFDLPDDAPPDDTGDGYLVPVAILRKAPGSFTRFDLVDEHDRRLRLCSREQAATVSAEMLVMYATDVLQASRQQLPKDLEVELRFIAKQTLDFSVAILRYQWPTPDGRTSPGAMAATTEAEKRALVADPGFYWLLRTLANSSVLLASVVRKQSGRRGMVKLSYEETAEQVSDLDGEKSVGLGGRMARALGWRGYLSTVVFPWVDAKTFHFELHVPAGLQLVEAGFRGMPAETHRGRAHQYLPNALGKRTVVAYFQLAVRGTGFTTAAAVTSWMIALVLGGCLWRAADLTGGASSAASLLLLFPGLVATYVARPEHPLVNGLLALVKVALGLSAGLVYLAAARVALLSTEHPADLCHLRLFFLVELAIALVIASALTATVWLPRSYSEFERSTSQH